MLYVSCGCLSGADMSLSDKCHFFLAGVIPALSFLLTAIGNNRN